MAKQKIGYYLYNTFLALAALLLLPIIIFRIIINFKSLSKPLSNISNNLKPIVWIHVASERQMATAEIILEELISMEPGYQLLLTYTGINPASVYQSVDSDQLIISLPYPVELWPKKLVSIIKPRLFLMIEECFYPNLIRHCKAIGSKVALIDGRVDNRLSIVYRLTPNFLRESFNQIDLFMMSSVTEANQVGELGAPVSKIVVTNAVAYQDTWSKDTDGGNDQSSVNQAVSTIGTLLGRNL